MIRSVDREEKIEAYKAMSLEERKARYKALMDGYKRNGNAPSPGWRWTTFREYDRSGGQRVQTGLTGKAYEEYKAAEAARTKAGIERMAAAKAEAGAVEYDEEAKKLLAQGLKEWRGGDNRRIYLKGNAGYYDVAAHKYR